MQEYGEWGLEFTEMEAFNTKMEAFNVALLAK